MKSLNDITAIQDFAYALEDSKNASDKLFDYFPVVFLLVDDTKRVIKANSLATEFFGLDEVQLLGRIITQLFDDDTAHKFDEYFSLDPMNREATEFEVNCKKQDSYVFWHLNTLPLSSGAENLHILIGSVTTELRKSHRRLVSLEKSLEVSQTVQSKLLPEKSHIKSDHFELSGSVVPAENVAGDWWWYSEEDGGFDLVVGDITGHGVGAAMTCAVVTGATRAIRTFVDQYQKNLSMTQFLGALNDIFVDVSQGVHLMTVFALSARPDKDHIEAYFCGSPPISVLGSEGGKPKTYLSAGTPLGFEKSPQYIGHLQIPFKKGDRLFICTDGAYEFNTAPTGQNFSRRLLVQHLKNHGDKNTDDAKNALLEYIQENKIIDEYEDDITLVIIDRL